MAALGRFVVMPPPSIKGLSALEQQQSESGLGTPGIPRKGAIARVVIAVDAMGHNGLVLGGAGSEPFAGAPVPHRLAGTLFGSPRGLCRHWAWRLRRLFVGPTPGSLRPLLSRSAEAGLSRLLTRGWSFPVLPSQLV